MKYLYDSTQENVLLAMLGDKSPAVRAEGVDVIKSHRRTVSESKGRARSFRTSFVYHHAPTQNWWTSEAWSKLKAALMWSPFHQGQDRC